MPCGSKKRKTIRKKKEAEGNNQSSIEEESSNKLESIDENTTVPAVDDGLDSNKENSSLSVVDETDDQLVGNDHGEVLNSNKENLVIEACVKLSRDDDSVVVVQENVQPLSQNMHAHQISEQLKGLKKIVFEVLCEVDKMRTTLHKLLDGLTEMQQTIVEQ